MRLRPGDAVAVALTAAIRGGDRSGLERLLAEDPTLASARIVDRRGRARTPLHLATDWPGYFPEGPAIVATLCDAGADPNAPILGAPHAETPLHWAASSDDVDVAAVLIDRGADLEAQGASIAGGSPLDDAVGYGCWHVARLLVARGARVDRLWHAAALGLRDRLDELLSAAPADPGPADEAFWQACHGGQRRVAEHLLGLGADIDAHPGYTDRTPLQIAAGPDTRRDALVTWLREHGAAG